MALPGVYDRLFVYANGSVLGESDSVALTCKGDPIPVATFLKDFAGVTPTPKSFEIQVSSFVPQKGFELDVIKLWLETKSVKIRLQFGGSQLMVNVVGYIAAPSIKSSATDNTKLDFNIMANAAPFA
jgi:hypothetical protein